MKAPTPAQTAAQRLACALAPSRTHIRTVVEDKKGRKKKTKYNRTAFSALWVR